MPTPDHRAPAAPLSAAFEDAFKRSAPTDRLASEVAALREEIAALRADLLPSPSPILTGPEVQRAYARMYARNHFPTASKGTL